MARCTSGGNGQVTSRLQFSSPPYASSGSSDTSKPGGTWEQVNQPFIASADIPQGKGELTLMLGTQKQTVEIAAIRLLNYGPKFDLAHLPRKRASHAGRDDNAPWRKQTLDRIEKIRKADHSAQVELAAAAYPCRHRQTTRHHPCHLKQAHNADRTIPTPCAASSRSRRMTSGFPELPWLRHPQPSR